jgi:hypothetical protein
LSACKPVILSKEVICECDNVDQHALYAFYLVALPIIVLRRGLMSEIDPKPPSARGSYPES